MFNIDQKEIRDSLRNFLKKNLKQDLLTLSNIKKLEKINKIKTKLMKLIQKMTIIIRIRLCKKCKKATKINLNDWEYYNDW